MESQRAFAIEEESANSQVQEGFLSTTTVYTCKAFTEPLAQNAELTNTTETHVTRRAKDTKLLLELVSLPLSVDHEKPDMTSRQPRRPSKPDANTYRWAMTRSTRSMMFFGHAFLNIAPRFSGAGAAGSLVLRAFFAFG